MKAVLIPVDMTEPITQVDVDNDWRSLAKAIGAQYIECVRVFPGDNLAAGRPILVVDESGAITQGRERNARASALHPSGLWGPALVVGEKLTPGEDGLMEPDIVGLEDIPARGTNWCGYVASKVYEYQWNPL